MYGGEVMRDDNSSLLDREFAKFMAGRSMLPMEKKKLFEGIVCRLSESLAAGDSCLSLDRSEQDVVLDSNLAGDGSGVSPLCLFGGRLYLQRTFQYEQRLAWQVQEMVEDPAVLPVDESLLDALFETSLGETDWQRYAAVQALGKRFLIISGGPGTGKTTVVVNILALLQAACGGQIKVALAAPTGKAAMRLQESVSSSRERLRLAGVSDEGIPDRAFTIHRLLGVKHHSPFFRHTAARPLGYDVVVIDEASMVDLALMSKLVDALRPGSRLILLGDKDQLASVESGTVLADMIRALPDNTVELQHSYRFNEGIRNFAAVINGGEAGLAWSVLAADEPANVTLLHGDVAEYGGSIYSQYMKAVVAATGLEEYGKLFESFNAFKILCAVRHGPSGVHGVNGAVERYLTENGYDCPAGSWYRGRPVMITRNEYGLDLYNGDIGLCLPDPVKPDVLKIWFKKPDGGLQGLLPARLCNCETVYALTIHKSQGAEFGEVLVVLPEKHTVVVSRELLYTAVTRARGSVRVKAERTVFDAAVTGKITRSSGLVELLVSEGKRLEK